MFKRQSNYESRSFSRRAIGGNPPPVAFNYFAADGKPHSCSGVLTPAVQPLERGKDTVKEFLIKSDSVILYINAAGRFAFVAVDPD